MRERGAVVWRQQMCETISMKLTTEEKERISQNKKKDGVVNIYIYIYIYICIYIYKYLCYCC